MLPVIVGLMLPQPAMIGLLYASLSISTLDPTLFHSAESPNPSSIPVLEVVKVYGKLAGSECYGKSSPKGSSCQAKLQDIEKVFHLDDSGSGILTLEQFREDLNQAGFRWPLKPYGVDKSLSKTSTMNKGAETRVFMDELEERGLYDKHNPTGPLPTSLRPQLNTMMQKEGVDLKASELIFRALGGGDGKLDKQELKRVFSANEMDYYGFLDQIGKEAITWPY